MKESLRSLALVVGTAGLAYSASGCAPEGITTASDGGVATISADPTSTLEASGIPSVGDETTASPTDLPADTDPGAGTFTIPCNDEGLLTFDLCNRINESLGSSETLQDKAEHLVTQFCEIGQRAINDGGLGEGVRDRIRERGVELIDRVYDRLQHVAERLPDDVQLPERPQLSDLRDFALDVCPQVVAADPEPEATGIPSPEGIPTIPPAETLPTVRPDEGGS